MILQGEGVLALEASVCCALSKGDGVLVLDSGPFGKSFGDCARACGVEVGEISCSYSEAPDVEEIKKRMNEIGYRALIVVHCETPTGIINDVKNICNEAKKRGVLTIVDTVSSLDGMHISPESDGIDLCITASQKCLSYPPVLSMIFVSADAGSTIERAGLRGSYLNILDVGDS